MTSDRPVDLPRPQLSRPGRHRSTDGLAATQRITAAPSPRPASAGRSVPPRRAGGQRAAGAAQPQRRLADPAPVRRPARKPASKLSPAPVASTASTGEAADGDLRLAARARGRTVGAALDDDQRARARVDGGGLLLVHEQHVDVGQQRRQAAVPARRSCPPAGRPRPSPRRRARRRPARAGPAAGGRAGSTSRCGGAARPPPARRRHLIGSQRRDRARQRQHRPVAALHRGDGDPGGRGRLDGAAGARRRRGSAISPSMNRPNSSSPTTPTKAVRSPSRAAPQAVIEAEPPTVSSIPETSFSRCPNSKAQVVAGDQQVRVAVPENEQIVHRATLSVRSG